MNKVEVINFIKDIRKYFRLAKRSVLLLGKSIRINGEFDESILSVVWPDSNPELINKVQSIHYDLNEYSYDLSLIIPLYDSMEFLPNLVKMLLDQITNYKFE